MPMRPDLLSLVREDPAVAALVARRVYWDERPQGKPLPSITLQVISKVGGHTLDAPEDLKVARVQVDCWARSSDEADALEGAVEATLDGYRGGAFQGVFLENTRGSREGGTTEADRPFRVSMDFMVHFNRS